MVNKVTGGPVLKEVKTRLAPYSGDFSNQLVTIIRLSPPPNLEDPTLLAKYEAARFSTEHKVKTFKALGCEVEHLNLDASTTNVEFGRLLKQVNEKSIAVIVQNPFPADFKDWLSEISYEKDIDGLRKDNPFFRVSATSETIFRIVEPFVQDNDVVAVVGAKGFVGRGVTRLLEDAGISVIDLDKKDDLTLTRQANIVVSAMGSPNELDERHIIPEHRLVVDAGFIPLADSPILGDVNRSAYDIPQNITPVPGGVGPFQMGTLMERLIIQVTGKQIEKWQYRPPWVEQQQTDLQVKPRLEDWPKYASALERSEVRSQLIKDVLETHQSGSILPSQVRGLFQKDFAKFLRGLASIKTWRSNAQQLKSPIDILQTIEKVEQGYLNGQPLTKEVKTMMKEMANQAAYHRCSVELNPEDPSFLNQVVVNAAKAGLNKQQILGALSMSPQIQSIRAKRGEQESVDEAIKIMRASLPRNKQQQRKPNPRQQNTQDEDNGPKMDL